MISVECYITIKLLEGKQNADKKVFKSMINQSESLVWYMVEVLKVP